jgi:hypothetical protein
MVMVVVVFRHEDLADPMESVATYLRVEEQVETCDGVPCQHPAAPDAPPHDHVIVSGEFPLAADRCFAVWDF